MLFFFELGLFVLAMLTLALGEFVNRVLALSLWLVCTAASLAGYAAALRLLPRPRETRSGLDEKWAGTLLYTWRRTNAVLLVGAILVGAWYWAAGR